MAERIDIDRVLMQMRAMRAQVNPEAMNPGIQGVSRGLEGAGESNRPTAPGFSEMLAQAVDKVNETQQQSGALSRAFELGDPNVTLTQVMVASEKASVSFEAMTQVRNKLVDAYEKIMNMPI